MIIFSTFDVNDVAEVSLKSKVTPTLDTYRREDFLDVYEAIHNQRKSHSGLCDRDYNTFRAIMRANILAFQSDKASGNPHLLKRCRKLYSYFEVR